jgi:periplasmic protein TonB
VKIRTCILCGSVGLGALCALCALIPLMNRAFQGRPPGEPPRALRWVSIAKKPAELSAPPARPAPKRPAPAKPAPRPVPSAPSAGKAAPSAPRASAPAAPLRIDPWEIGLGSPGQAPLFVPPEPEPPGQGAPDPGPEKALFEPKEIYAPGGGDELPRPTRRVLPEYPSRALDRRVEGHVLIGFVIDRTGAIQDVRILDWKGSREFCKPAVEALARWTFEPGRCRGQPVCVRLSQRFIFREEE